MNNAAHEFLRDDMRNRRFGVADFVVFNSDGTVTPTISLTQPQADNLLHGKTIDGDILVPDSPNDIAAWQISCTASPALNLLYAVAPQRISSAIKTAQARASHEIVNELAGCILNVGPRRGCLGMKLDGRRDVAPTYFRNATETLGTHSLTGEVLHCPIVIFRTEVSQDQYPNLNTTAFLVNRIRLQDGRVHALVISEGMDRISLPLYESYAGALDFFIEQAIGPFHRASDILELRIEGVPQEVVRKFFYGPRSNSNGFNQTDQVTLNKQGLFQKWQAKATSLGWGPKEATAFFHQLRSDQYWGEVIGQCTRAVKHPFNTLRGASHTLRSSITRIERDLGHRADPSREMNNELLKDRWKSRTQQGINRLREIKDSLQKLLKLESKHDNGVLNQTQNNADQRHHSLDTARNSINQLVEKRQSRTTIPKGRSKDNWQGHSH